MAIAAFKVKVFADFNALTKFVKEDAGVNTVVQIVTDNSGQWFVFYV